MTGDRVDDEAARELEEAAARTGSSKGAIVRELIRTNLRTSKAGAWEQWRKFAGIVEGPSDISTNMA